MPPKALLAIRSDITPSVEAEYLEWLTKEHTIERVGIDGFVSARIFRAQHAAFGRYWILYELSDTAVVDSPAYLERLNNPTPWSTRMMPHLGNFIRGGGQIITASGTGYGAALVPILIQSDLDVIKGENLKALSKVSGVIAVRTLQTDQSRTAVTSSERTLRTGDQSFTTLLMIEALDSDAAISAKEQLQPSLLRMAHLETEKREDPVYSLIFYLNG